jgi:hypothetical protein
MIDYKSKNNIGMMEELNPNFSMRKSTHYNTSVFP